MCRKEPWAHHALGHVMLTEGRLAEGLAFMQGVSDTWTGLNSFMVTHNWWHVALFLIDLGRDAEALAVYDQQVWGVVKDYSQDQIGAVSLLARFELAGIDVGDRWQDLADHLAQRARRPRAALPRPAIPLRPRARRPARGRRAAAQHRGLRAECASRRRAPPGSACACRPRTGCWPTRAATSRRPSKGWALALPRLIEIGGSHAQRDLFEQVYLDALVRIGTEASLAGAQGILQQQLNGQPESLRLRRQAAAVYARLGLPAFG